MCICIYVYIHTYTYIYIYIYIYILCMFCFSAQVGTELPAYVHNPSIDTYQQCLVSDIAFSVCKSSYTKTSRLCRCVP